LDALREPFRSQVWAALADRARDIDRFIAPSRYVADLMSRRLGLDPERVRVVPNGINLEGYACDTALTAPDPKAPVLGYFARMCREKGLDTLVEAFLILKKRGRVTRLRLCVGGGCGPSDQSFVDGLRERLRAGGCIDDAAFHPNVSRDAKLALLRGMTVMSVPALYGEAFGLYVVEAMASGVPVVQPRHAAFPEIVEATGGGMLCEPGDPESLADTLESLLLKPERARALAAKGREAVMRDYSVESMTDRVLDVYRELLAGGGSTP
jgi:glycosyltransferase involved in cell wall biosynthesis